MIVHLTRHAAIFVVALGMLLNGAFPCCAYAGVNDKTSATADMPMMPDMPMQQASKPLAEKGTPVKGVPCNDLNGCFAFCTCAIPVLFQDGFSVPLFHYGDVWFASDANRDGITILPDLPPPIA
jgi:hypothetical protein